MAVGLPLKTTYANGDVYSASDVNDTNGTVNLVGQTQNFYAGKNKIINGDFGVWQRGTTFTAIGSNAFGPDRYRIGFDGTGVRTVSQQTFTAGTAPVAGYEGRFFCRVNQTTAGTGGTFNLLVQPIEDVRTFAGQTVVLSFWAKADASRTITTNINQYFGSGGSPSGNVTNQSGNLSLTTSWTRFTYSVTLGSLSGKTIGTNNDSSLQVLFNLPLNTLSTIDIWGVQLEAGSTATAFQTATGTIQGELAACQRYYNRYTAPVAITPWVMGACTSGTQANFYFQLPVTMRTNPSVLDYSTIALAEFGGGLFTVTNAVIGYASNKTVTVTTTVSGGQVQGRPMQLLDNSSTSGFIGFSAEL